MHQIIIIVFLLISAVVYAAPYGSTGLELKYKQPDGTTLNLRCLGDEFEARTETQTGYTVLFNDSDLFYYYAVRDPVNDDLILSPYRVGEDDPSALGVDIHLTAPPKIRSLRRKKSLVENQFRPDLDTQHFIRGKPLGDFNGLCVLLAFADDPIELPHSKAIIDQMFNQKKGNAFDNSGSVFDYFLDESNGKFRLNTQVVGYYRLPHNRSYYNDITLNCGILSGRVLNDVCRAIKEGSLLIDKTHLTRDKRGAISGLSFYYHGENSGVWSRGLWPHATRGRPLTDVGDGLFIGDYQITNIGMKPAIGTICHELLHLVCGLPDAYDYGTGGRGSDDFIQSSGLGLHCMMAGANHLNGGRTPGIINPYFKHMIGWNAYKPLPNTGIIEVNTHDSVLYTYQKPGAPHEYFIIENINKKRNIWSQYLLSEGILIWHVDEKIQTGCELQQMNENEHYVISLMQADGRYDLELKRPHMHGNWGDVEDYFNGSNVRKMFSDLTIPSAHFWDGSPSGLNLVEIEKPAEIIRIKIGPRDGTQLLEVEGHNPVN